MVKLMLHCVLVVYINPLAVELKDLWSDCRNTRMQMYIKKKKKKGKSKNAVCLLFSYNGKVIRTSIECMIKTSYS